MKITIMSLSFLNNNPNLISIDGVIEGSNYLFLRERMMSKYPSEIVLYDKEIEIPSERLEILYS